MRKPFILASAVIMGLTFGLLAPNASYAGGGGHGERYPPQQALAIALGTLAYLARDAHRTAPVHYQYRGPRRQFGPSANCHHGKYRGRHAYRGAHRGHGWWTRRGHGRWNRSASRF